MVLLLRSLLRSRAALRGAPRFFSAASKPASEAAKPKGPPFARYFWYTTAIMIGIPGAVGAVFVYNLQSDDEFYSHFNDRYPDLIEAIDAYVPLNESLLELAKREDVGPIGSTEDLINETVTVVATLQSGDKVRFEAPGAASQKEIEALALKQSAQPENDRVVAITFAENDDEEKEVKAPTEQQAWPPAPRVTWGSAAKTQKKTKPADSAKELQLQIDEIRAQQAALEEAKYAGRDIDEADEEIAALELQKTALKEQLPRKRFLWIF